MKNSTNILLIVVIILLFAIIVDKRLETNTLKADSGGAIDHMIFTPDPVTKGFYLVNVEKKNIMLYEYDQGTRSILLKSARHFEFDELLLESFASRSGQGSTYAEVKKEVEAQGKKKPN